MSDRFEEELMEDLGSEPEARSQAMDGLDELDEVDEIDALDELDEADELEAVDEWDEMAEVDALEADAAEDEFEEAMTDALEAADTDEFFGKIGGFLKKIGRGVGKVARVVAPIASAIPIPQAQLIGRAAGLVGNVLADEGDELDAFDDLADYAEEEDAIDALAPAIATVAIRAGLKEKTAQLPRAHRRQLVKTVTAATRHLVRKHGPKAINAVPVIAAQAHRLAARKRLPTKYLPKVVSRTAKAAVKSPRVLRSMVSAGTKMRAAHFGHRHRSRGSRHGLASYRSRSRGGIGSAGGGLSRSYRSGTGATPSVCANCGTSRSWRLNGPVRITVEGA
ncbi:MAG TPA: hypothetical protein VKR31_02580 [Rhizomicrobium sp.]|nr:hypothetical protein [Rhizomicrobium sp.]